LPAICGPAVLTGFPDGPVTARARLVVPAVPGAVPLSLAASVPLGLPPGVPVRVTTAVPLRLTTAVSFRLATAVGLAPAVGPGLTAAVPVGLTGLRATFLVVAALRVSGTVALRSTLRTAPVGALQRMDAGVGALVIEVAMPHAPPFPG
jgi:hypothetical protein